MQSDINWEIKLPSFLNNSAQEIIDITNSILISNFKDSMETWLNEQVENNNLKSFKKNKPVYYKNTSNELLWGSEWDVPNFAECIETATLYDSSEMAEEVCSNIGFGNFKIYPVCPRCHNEYECHPAISRYDNKTEICEKCGLMEGLWAFFEYEKKATNS